MRNVVIVDGVRTPFGKLGGGLRKFYMTELGAHAVRALLDRTGVQERCGIDCVFFGSAFGDAHSTNVARYVSLAAGLPHETTASFVEMQCGSSIDAVNHAAWKIAMGYADVIIAGGGESYSTRAAKFSMSVEPYKMIPPTAIPNQLSPKKDEAIDMVTISDLIATRWNITREAADEFALRSQNLAQKAMESGWTKQHIAPVVIPATRKTPEIVVAQDEGPRVNLTLDQLTKLRSVYEGGTTTAGNSCGRNDGASAVLLMSEEKALALGYTPLVRWKGSAEYGVDPRYMGIGPAYSNLKLLRQAGLSLADIDIIECNEAFAAQNLAVIHEMEAQSGSQIDLSRWNPNGGAIAYGHPNGASGTRILTFAMQELHDVDGRYAIVSSCCGGGLGVSTLLEKF